MGSVMSDVAEQSIIIDLWTVPDGSRDEFMSGLVGLFERLRELDGFLDGQILKGVNPSMFVSYARMRSARERDAALIDPVVQAATRNIGGIVRPRPHAYTVARAFTPAARERPAV
jgi:hypothetical protein